MSFQAMTWAVEQKLPAMQKIVLLMMANRANHETGQCYPSHELLATECGMSKRAVIDQISQLEKLGLIEVIRSVGTNGVKNANKYRLRLHLTINCSAGAALGVVQELHEGSAGAAHKPVIEPVSINQSFNHKDIATQKVAAFKKPTISEIGDYCESECLAMDHVQFFDYYEANGWVVGKTKMKDWKAAARNWTRRNQKYNGAENANRSQNTEQRNKPACKPSLVEQAMFDARRVEERHQREYENAAN